MGEEDWIVKKPHMTSKPNAVEYKQDMHQAMWASSVYVVILATTSRKKNQHAVIYRVGSVLLFLAEMVRVVLLEVNSSLARVLTG